MLSVYRDTDCERCDGGDHCAKCLELIPVSQSQRLPSRFYKYTLSAIARKQWYEIRKGDGK